MVEQLTRWYLRNEAAPDIAELIERDRPGFSELVAGLPEAATGAWRTEFDDRYEQALEVGVPEPAARFGALVSELVSRPTSSPSRAQSGRTVRRGRTCVLPGRRAAVPGRDRGPGRGASGRAPAGSGWRGRPCATTCGCCAARSCRGVIDQCARRRYRCRRRRLPGTRADPYERLARLIESTAGATGRQLAVMVMVHQIRQVVLAREPAGRRDLPVPAAARRRTRSTGIRGATRRSPRPASRDLPILLSVGYSACHWCHVMEHESF